MKRPKLKKASKRVSCAKRFKIQKKVREHNRKLRKEAKKKGISRKPKKDVGVPNSAPFKEEVLREAEQRKQELEAQKQQNKVIKQEERKRKKDKEAASAEDGPAAKKAKKVEKAKVAKAAAAKEKNSKTFRCSELNKVIEASDVIVEVLDARDPLGCRCPQLEEAILKHEGKKKLLFILNKIDLVPKENLEKWLRYLEAECPTFVFKAATQVQDRTVQQKKQSVAISVDHSRAAVCFGSSSLLQTLGDMAAIKDEEKMLKVGVVGFPNVGKSSIINSLKEIRACNVGVQRGLTRCMQEVHISKKVKMIDSPGIVAAPSNPGDVMALRSLEVEENEKSPLDAVNTLLKQCNQQHIMLQYNVPDYRNSLEFLTTFAKKRGFLQKGGVPNTELAATTFLGDWTGAKLSYHCRVPERQGLPSYLSDAIVTDLQSGLNMDKVRRGNEDVIKSVRFPNLASSISFNSKGPTAGVLKVSEMPTEKQTVAVMTTTTTTDVEEMDAVSNTEAEVETPALTPETQTQKPTQKGKGKKPVEKAVKIVTINTDLTSIQLNSTEDAYDFNTDFV